MSAQIQTTEKAAHGGDVPVSQNKRYLPHPSKGNGHPDPVSRLVPDCGGPGSVTYAQQTLIHGDFFENDLPDESFDLILTDSPWGCIGKDVLPWDVPLDLDRMAAEFDRILSPTGQVAIFANVRFLGELWQPMRERFSFRYDHVWQKSGQPVNLMQPISDHELILVFKKRDTKTRDLTFNAEAVGAVGISYIKPNYTLDNPTRKTLKSPVSENKTGLRWPRGIVKAPAKPNMTKTERSDHPTQKPVFLLSYLIKLLSNEGDLVLDPFAGSGSTLVACHEHDRRGIGFEISQDYYTAACERLRNITAQERLPL